MSNPSWDDPKTSITLVRELLKDDALKLAKLNKIIRSHGISDKAVAKIAEAFNKEYADAFRLQSKRNLINDARSLLDKLEADNSVGLLMCSVFAVASPIRKLEPYYDGTVGFYNKSIAENFSEGETFSSALTEYGKMLASVHEASKKNQLEN
jgi:hypothetical protein